MVSNEAYRIRRRTGVAAAALVLIAAGSLAARSARLEARAPTAPEALAPFEALIGGAWHFDGSYQVFEWGVGRELVRARSYTIAAGDTTLISEGVLFWHPGEEEIRGYIAAIAMPVSLFEYVTRVEGGLFTHQLRAYGDMGGEYVERWELVDEDHYQWTLQDGSTADGPPLMNGTFQRVPWPEH